MELHIPPWEKENHLQISFGRGYVSYQNQLAFNNPHLLARSAGNSRFFGMKSHYQLLCDVCQYRAARRIFQIATYHLMNSWRRFFVCCRCKEFEGLTGGKKKKRKKDKYMLHSLNLFDTSLVHMNFPSPFFLVSEKLRWRSCKRTLHIWLKEKNTFKAAPTSTGPGTSTMNESMYLGILQWSSCLGSHGITFSVWIFSGGNHLTPDTSQLRSASTHLGKTATIFQHVSKCYVDEFPTWFHMLFRVINPPNLRVVRWFLVGWLDDHSTSPLSKYACSPSKWPFYGL